MLKANFPPENSVNIHVLNVHAIIDKKLAPKWTAGDYCKARILYAKEWKLIWN